MSIYTKTGDSGQTSLYGGDRVSKTAAIIEAIGDVDELNSCLSLLEDELDKLRSLNLSDKVRQIEKNLFMLGADLASPLDLNKKLKVVRINGTQTAQLEKDMDDWEKIIPSLTHFVLPGGHKAALYAYYARAVCRRAERAINRANKTEKLDAEILKYVNRLGDWLFVCFRLINHKTDEAEHLWVPEKAI